MTKQNKSQNTDDLFAPLENTKLYFKAAFQGFAGSGKTYTAALVALGLHRMIGSKKPIVIFDTERASKFLKTLFADHKIDVLVRESRSMADLALTMRKLREEGIADLLIIDSILKREPIKVASGRYDEKLRPERTQADLINEMAQELNSLPRFTAYAKVLKEGAGVQTVVKSKMRTLPMRPMGERYPVREGEFGEALEKAEKKGFQEAERRLTEKTALGGMSRSRVEIEKEIRARQEPWRGRGRMDKPPPGRSEGKGREREKEAPPPGRH